VFKAPVRIGDSIRVEGEVTKTRELDDEHGLVECRWRVLNQDDKMVLRVNVEVVWRAEPALI
jgi:acyl dehydratase